MLARAVAKELGVPCRRLLYRAHGAPQSGHDRAARLLGPAFRARAPRPGLRVLLVDDVVTTGATLHAAAQSLLDAGIADVRCIAAAATPAPSARRPAARRSSSWPAERRRATRCGAAIGGAHIGTWTVRHVLCSRELQWARVGAAAGASRADHRPRGRAALVRRGDHRG